MKYAVITLDNSIQQAELSSLKKIHSPKQGYVELWLTTKPTPILGEVLNLEQNLEEAVLTLLLPYAPKITFTNTSRL